MRQTTESGCLLPLLAKKCGLERSAVDRDEGARRLSAAGPAERPEEDLPGSSEKRWNKPPLPNIRRDGNSPFTCEPASCIEPFPPTEGLLFSGRGEPSSGFCAVSRPLAHGYGIGRAGGKSSASARAGQRAASS